MLEDACKRFIWATFLYEEGEESPLTDDDFVILSHILYKNYKDLPKWFRNRVSLSNLRSTTGSSLVYTFTKKEKKEAILWRDNIKKGIFV